MKIDLDRPLLSFKKDLCLVAIEIVTASSFSHLFSDTFEFDQYKVFEHRNLP